MLSRVADSLYWMSRYFERADNCARAIEATHGLMLSRAEVAHDQRWYRALTSLGLPPTRATRIRRLAIGRLAADGPEPRLDRLVHRRRARQRLAGARGDQLRDVGAAQPAVPRGRRLGDGLQDAPR